jgi:hypothetical protein
MLSLGTFLLVVVLLTRRDSGRGRSGHGRGVVSGPVFAVIPAPSLSNSILMSAKSAISMVNAIRVNIAAAKNAARDARMGMTTWVENSVKKNARKVRMVAAHKNIG